MNKQWINKQIHNSNIESNYDMMSSRNKRHHLYSQSVSQGCRKFRSTKRRQNKVLTETHTDPPTHTHINPNIYLLVLVPLQQMSSRTVWKKSLSQEAVMIGIKLLLSSQVGFWLVSFPLSVCCIVSWTPPPPRLHKWRSISSPRILWGGSLHLLFSRTELVSQLCAAEARSNMSRICLNSKILLLRRDNNYNTAAGVLYRRVTFCKVDAVMVIVNVNFEILKKNMPWI